MPSATNSQGLSPWKTRWLMVVMGTLFPGLVKAGEDGIWGLCGSLEGEYWLGSKFILK